MYELFSDDQACRPWVCQIFADQLTLFQPGGTDYAHLITTALPPPDFPTLRRPWVARYSLDNIQDLIPIWLGIETKVQIWLLIKNGAKVYSYFFNQNYAGSQ